MPYLRDHGGLHNPSIRTYKDSCPSKVLIDNLQRLNHDLRFANRDEQMSSLDDHFPYSLVAKGNAPKDQKGHMAKGHMVFGQN